MGDPVEIVVSVKGAAQAASETDKVTEAYARMQRALDAAGARADKLRKQGVSESALDADPILKSLYGRADAFERLAKAGGGVADIGREVNTLGNTLRLLPTLDRALGGTRLPMLTGDIRLLRAAMSDLSVSWGALGAAAATGGLVALLMGAQGAATAQNLETLANAAENNSAVLKRINAMLNAGEQSGTLGSETVAAFKKRLASLTELQNLITSPDAKPTDVVGYAANASLPNSVRNLVRDFSGETGQKQQLSATLQSETAGLLAQIRNASGPTFQTADALALTGPANAAANAGAQGERGIAAEKNRLRELLEDRTLFESQKVALIVASSKKISAILRTEQEAEQAVIDAKLGQNSEARSRPGVSNDPEKLAQLDLQRNALRAQANALSSQYLSLAQRETAEAQKQIEAQKQSKGFGQELKGDLVELAQSWSNIGANAAHALTGGIKVAIDGISNAIAASIFHVQRWGQVFQQIGEQIVASLIKIGVQYLATAAAAAVLDLFTFGAGGAAGGATGGFNSSIVASPAASASGGMPAYAAGGFNSDSLIARVSPGEWITRASAVRNLGTGFMAGINQNLVDLNRLPPGARVAGLPQGAAGGGSSPQVINLHFHGDESAALKAAASTPTGRNVIVDTVRQSARQVTRGQS